MALTEDGAETRDGYEKIIGLYANGYRASIVAPR